MNNIKISDSFGSFCAKGDKAILFLQQTVLPLIENKEKIVFDFKGVKNMNSSFANALFANLVMRCGQGVMEKISFINCRPNIKMLISAALEMGMRKAVK